MDNFAQTREADDLFDSEFSAPQSPPLSAPTEPWAFSSRGGQGTSRGGGGGGGGRGGFQPGGEDPPKETKTVEGAPEGPAADSKEAKKQEKQDRTLSGGLKKAKLTEEELSQRMEQVRLGDQRRVERYRKAKEDENHFHAQEEARKQVDATERVAERKKKVEQDRSRKELDDERERNKQRKLSAVNSREWDSEKTEEDYNPRKQSSQFRRGAYGGVLTDSRDSRGSPSSHRGFSSGHRGSSSGYRGSPSGYRGFSGGFSGPRGSPGGSHRNATASRGPSSNNPATTQEWPDLPPAAKENVLAEDVSLSATDEAAVWDVPPNNDQPEAMKDQPSVEARAFAEDTSPAGDKALERTSLGTGDHITDTISPLSPAVGGGTWAEQVESAS